MKNKITLLVGFLVTGAFLPMCLVYAEEVSFTETILQITVTENGSPVSGLNVHGPCGSPEYTFPETESGSGIYSKAIKVYSAAGEACTISFAQLPANHFIKSPPGGVLNVRVFDGGTMQKNVTVGESTTPPPPPPPGGGGGGGGGGPTELYDSCTAIKIVGTNSSATITAKSSQPSFSRVVYGKQSFPNSFQPNDTYGYGSTTAKTTSMTLEQSATITDLASGTYYFRMIINTSTQVTVCNEISYTVEKPIVIAPPPAPLPKIEPKKATTTTKIITPVKKSPPIIIFKKKPPVEITAKKATSTPPCISAPKVVENPDVYQKFGMFMAAALKWFVSWWWLWILLILSWIYFWLRRRNEKKKRRILINSRN